MEGPPGIDLVHLLAELLDNAAAFSPPAAPIVVTGAGDGDDYLIEVADRGLGMTDEELAWANQRLAGDAARDPATAQAAGATGDQRFRPSPARPGRHAIAGRDPGEARPLRRRRRSYTADTVRVPAGCSPYARLIADAPQRADPHQAHRRPPRPAAAASPLRWSASARTWPRATGPNAAPPSPGWPPASPPSSTSSRPNAASRSATSTAVAGSGAPSCSSSGASSTRRPPPTGPRPSVSAPATSCWPRRSSTA